MSEANKPQGGPPAGGHGPGHPGRHGRGMMGGKPKNAKETVIEYQPSLWSNEKIESIVK